MFPFCCAMAQEEYTWEMGGVIGGSFYMGDANSSTPFKDTGIAGGFIARYLLNPHMAIKGNLTAGRISGDTRDFKNVYPNGEYATFKRTIIDLGAQFEYNFLDMVSVIRTGVTVDSHLIYWVDWVLRLHQSL